MSFVAISRVKYPESLQAKIHEAGLNMIPIAQQQPGFISISFHQSHKSNETMMYWEWESQEDHETCMKSEAWANIMEKSKDAFQNKETVFSVETFERLA